MKTEVRFKSGDLSLEGVVDIPDGPGPFPAVIVCHPHPLYGGNMDNNVVFHVAEALVLSQFISFKFNFRGVEGSEGQYDNGEGEQGDVTAAISFVSTLKETDKRNIGVVGYSAGAAFSMPVAARDSRVKALATISPPLAVSDFAFLLDCQKPKLLILGDQDEYTLGHQFMDLCAKLPGPKECYMIPGADHFWWERESILEEKITPFFAKALGKGARLQR